MSKRNGKNNGIEKHHFDEPEGLPIGNGISIAAAGDGDAPSEVRLYKGRKKQGAEHPIRRTLQLQRTCAAR